MAATPMTPERPLNFSRRGSASSTSPTGRQPVRRRLSLAGRRGSAQSLTLGMASLGLWVEGGPDSLDSPGAVEDTRDDTASEQQRELLFETATVVMKRLSGQLSFGETADSDGDESTSDGYFSDQSNPGTPPQPRKYSLDLAAKPSPLAGHRRLSPRTTTTSQESIRSILSEETLGTAEAAAVRLDLDLDNLAEAIEEQEDEGEAHPDWAKDEFEQFLATLEYVPTPKWKTSPALARTARSVSSSNFRNQIDPVDEGCAASPKLKRRRSQEDLIQPPWPSFLPTLASSPPRNVGKHIKLGHGTQSRQFSMTPTQPC